MLNQGDRKGGINWTDEDKSMSAGHSISNRVYEPEKDTKRQAARRAELERILQENNSAGINGDDVGEVNIDTLLEALQREDSVVTSLFITNSKIDPKGIKEKIFPFLKDNNRICALSFRGNSIGNEGIEHLSYALEYNEALTYCNLSGNFSVCTESMNNRSGIAVEAALTRNKTLSIFKFSHNSIDDAGCKQLAIGISRNTSITSLDLSELSISPTGMLEILGSIKVNQSIMRLDFSVNEMNPVAAASFAEVLQVNQSLDTVELARNNMGDEGVRLIAPALGSNDSLISINLENNKIGPEGAMHMAVALKSNKKLASVKLGSNNMGDEGIKALAPAIEGSQSLTSLYLNGNKIGNEGAIALAPAIKGNQSLTFIDLKSNQIEFEGMVALFNAIQHNNTIVSINLNDNGARITKPNASRVAESLVNCRTLVHIGLRDVKFGPNATAGLIRYLEEQKNILYFENSFTGADSEKVEQILKDRNYRVNQLAVAWQQYLDGVPLIESDKKDFPLYATAISYVLETKLNEPELAASFERYIGDISKKPEVVTPTPPLVNATLSTPTSADGVRGGEPREKKRTKEPEVVAPAPIPTPTPTPPSAPATLPTSGSADSKGGKKESASPGGTKGESKPASSNKNSLLAALTGGTVSAGLFMVYARNASAALPKNYVVMAAGISLGVAAVAGICYHLRDAPSKDPEGSKSPGK